ncbi:hypothetical protein ACFOQM_23500 [Paenibacillus sp. GCM10012307]|uniref:Uncharacterized protein n=1 Tax=Paenibacillus roseus TaxID=2798579 RepID=A0A934J996_9BACL|nr:hypothetical protein [Paenibacillus roseus]MBJ6364189.1 hypothetical protein [Paenibacillus roseus]
MAKITETVTRSFTLELSEIEVRTLAAALIVTSGMDRDKSSSFEGEKLNFREVSELLAMLHDVIGTQPLD